jgi:NhaP-type Na+/H+ or K+/H+ antiporter
MLPDAIPAWSMPALAYALASLTFVRMLPVAVSLLGSGLRPASVMFLGWFGPRGLASILFALLIVEEERLQSGEMLGAVVVLTVFLSIFAHGVSAHPYARRYAARLARAQNRAAPEHMEVPELPVRIRHRTAGVVQ